MKTHQQEYPEQYRHPLCGKTVQRQDGSTFVVYRVVDSRFGQLAMSEADQTTAYAISTLEVLEEIPTWARESHEGVPMPGIRLIPRASGQIEV